MNEDQTFVGEVHRTNMQQALIAVVATGALMAIWYYLFGDKLSESARLAQKEEQTPLVNVAPSADSSWQVVEVEGRTPAAIVTGVGEQGSSPIPLTVVTQENEDAVIAARAESRAKLIAAQAIVSECDAALLKLQASIQEWEQRYAAVLDDDRGRRFASDSAAVEKLAAMFQEPLAGNEKLATWTQELNAIADPIRKAAASGDDFQVTDELRTYLQELLTRVTDANLRHASHQKLIDSLILSTQDQPLSAVTLRDAIAAYETRVAEELSVEATRRRKEELQKAIEEQSAAITEAEKRRIEADTQARVVQEEAIRQGVLDQSQELAGKVDAAKAKAAREKLEAEFRRDEAEINSLLTPFLFVSESQPAYGNANEPRSWIIPTAPLGPTSFSRLQGSGCLDDTVEGRKRLYYYAGWHMNLRKKGGFPQYSATGLNDPGVSARVARARELLLKYGPLLVEKGYLQQ